MKFLKYFLVYSSLFSLHLIWNPFRSFGGFDLSSLFLLLLFLLLIKKKYSEPNKFYLIGLFFQSSSSLSSILIIIIIINVDHQRSILLDFNLCDLRCDCDYSSHQYSCSFVVSCLHFLVVSRLRRRCCCWFIQFCL